MLENKENERTKIIQLNDKTDELEFDSTFEEFFSSGLDEFKLKIITKLDTQIENDVYLKDETYFGIYMFNKNDLCLNEMIINTRENEVILFRF